MLEGETAGVTKPAEATAPTLTVLMTKVSK